MWILAARFKPLEQPKVAVLVRTWRKYPGIGVRFGSVDKRFQMRPVLIENPSLTGKRLEGLSNVIILPMVFQTN